MWVPSEASFRSLTADRRRLVRAIVAVAFAAIVLGSATGVIPRMDSDPMWGGSAEARR